MAVAQVTPSLTTTSTAQTLVLLPLPTLVPVVYYDTDSSISLVFYKHPTDSYFG